MTINYVLPVIDLKKIKENHVLSLQEERIILGVIYAPVDGKGVLRATRPTDSTASSWLWRNLMVFASPEEKFHVLPSGEYWDSELSDDANSYMVLLLGNLVKFVLELWDESELPGLQSWKAANGIT